MDGADDDDDVGGGAEQQHVTRNNATQKMQPANKDSGGDKTDPRTRLAGGRSFSAVLAESVPAVEGGVDVGDGWGWELGDGEGPLPVRVHLR